LTRAALLAALLPALRSASAAPTPSPSPVTPPPGPALPAPAAHPSPTPQPKPDQWTEARRLFEQLPLDQQKKFLDNLNQWKAMSPEEQELLRDRELFRREKIAQEIQEAIDNSGLRLDNDQREVYALRYTQERRKIEEAIREETDAKRQAMVSDMLARLKLEFSPTPKKPAPP
jgi:hypothetical protein